MRIFVTGATGFIGSALVPELIQAGHQVLGLTRSEAGAVALRAAGADPLHGNLDNLACLREGAAAADGVIHLAFNHDFSRFSKNCENDAIAIAAMGEVLAGSARPIIITSGTAIASGGDGSIATEDSPPVSQNPRRASEIAARDLNKGGVNASVVRLSQVHNPRKQGLVPYIHALAREKKVSAYVGDGSNRWAAVPVLDTAQLYRLAIEKAEPGAVYHAVDEEGVPMKAIAEALARGLKIPARSIPPEQASAHFGWLAMFAGHDMPASSAITRKKLGWHPSGPGLIADLDAVDYTRAPI